MKMVQNLDQIKLVRGRRVVVAVAVVVVVGGGGGRGLAFVYVSGAPVIMVVIGVQCI